MKTCHNALQTALVCAFLTLLGLVACHPAQAQSGLVMDAPSGSSLLDQAAWNGTQTWLANPTQSAPGYFTLTDTTNGQYVGNGGSTALGANIVLENQAWTSGSPVAEQLWNFSYIDDNDVNIVNLGSGDAISVLNGSTSPGALLVQNTPGSAPSQNFTTVSPPFPLAQPTNGSVMLNWAPVPYATSYSVGRATSPGGPYTTLASSVAAGPYTDLTVTPGTTYYYMVAAAGLPLPYSTSNPVLATPGPSTNALPAAVPVNLGPWSSVTAIEMDGWNYQGPGFDGVGDTYSFNLTGSAILWNNILFPLSQPARPDCIADAGQRIILPSGNFTNLLVLGSYIGSSPTDNALFQPTITYTDGSSTVLTQGMTDWRGTATQPGESNAATYAYMNTNSGSKQSVTNYIHGYQIPIDPTRTTQWLDLPSTGSFRLLAMSGAPLVGALSQGQYLAVGQYIASPSGNCFLTQQSDGNLVLYNGSGPNNKGAAIWASGGHGAGSYYTILQSDGNLVTYTGAGPGSSGYPVWSSATYNGANYYLLVTDTKQVQIQSASGLIWQEPTPTIALLNPSAVAAGAATFTLTLTGTGYGGGSSVSANGTALTTQYVNYTTLTATVPASMLTAVGTLSITITNNGFTSAPATLTITANNPAPTLTSISPASVQAGGAAFTLTLTGTGYVPASVVTVGGTALTTKYVNATTLTVTVPASQVATAATLPVTVTNPGPGGGTSGAATLTVVLAPTTLTTANITGKIGATVTLTATLTQTNPSQGVANETISFTVNGASAGSATTNSAGVATVSYPVGTTAGAKTITATFAGDQTYVAASANGSLTVFAANAVDLSSFYNIIGIQPDGATYTGPGFDTYGYTYSFNLTGSAVTWSGNTFTLGPPSVPDCLSDAGQVIVLPSGNYSKLLLLATYLGSGPGSTGTFTPTITYTDGSSTVLSQGMTNWCGSGGQPGELNATTYSYRDHSDGSTQSITCYFHGYQIALNPAKTAQSLTLPNTGNFRLMALDLTPANPVVTTISVTPASASVVVGATQQFTATAYDQFGNVMSPQPSIAYSVSGGGTIGASSGVFTATTAGGPFTVTAASGGVSGTASVTVTPAPNFAVVATPGSVSIAEGSTGTDTISLTNTGGFSGTVALSASGLPAGVTAAFNPTSIAGSATSTVTFTVSPTAPAGSSTVTITGTSGSLVNSVTLTLTVTANPILTTITVAPSAAALSLNGAQKFTATAYDQFNTALATQPTFTWSLASGGVGAVSQTGAYSAGATAGTATVQAVSGSVTGAASVTVTNTAPTVATAASATPSPVTGTTTTLSALGADDGGAANLTYTWATTGTPPAPVTFSANGTNAAQSTTATFTTAGTYTFQVTITDTGGLSTTSSVTVTVNQTASSLSVTPASASVFVGSTQTFLGTAYDQFGNALAVQPSVAYSVSGGGAIGASSGVFTATTAGGPFTVTATTGGVSGTASVTVTAKANTTLTLISPTGAPGQTVSLTARLRQTVGGGLLSGRTLSFSVDGKTVGTAVTNASGLATFSYAIPANATVGNHVLTASFAGDSGDNAGTVNGTLTVTVPKAATTLTLINATGTRGKTVSLTARLRQTVSGTLLSGETLSFSVDGTVVGTAVTNSSGLAYFSYAIPVNATVGSHVLSASFAGDSANNPGSVTGTLTVN